MRQKVARFEFIAAALLVFFIMQCVFNDAFACQHNGYVLKGVSRVQVGAYIACWDKKVTKFLSRDEIQTLAKKMIEDNGIATVPIESPTLAPLLHIEIACLPTDSKSVSTVSFVINLQEDAKLSHRNQKEEYIVCTWTTERYMTMPKPSKEKYMAAVRERVQEFIDQWKQANK